MLDVCLGRTLADGASPYGLTFGDGAHKCLGVHIAIQESEIFLSSSFTLDDLRLERPPRVTMKPEISGYKLRDMFVAPDVRFAGIMSG